MKSKSEELRDYMNIMNRKETAPRSLVKEVSNNHKYNFEKSFMNVEIASKALKESVEALYVEFVENGHKLNESQEYLDKFRLRLQKLLSESILISNELETIIDKRK